MRRIGDSEGRQGFDLGEAPLLRLKVVGLGEAGQALLLSTHHMVFDGWSAGILMKELNENYRRWEVGEELDGEELEVQYGDYAAWQREWLSGAVLEEELGYWQAQLAGAETVGTKILAGKPRRCAA